jgi:hypothetical protein
MKVTTLQRLLPFVVVALCLIPRALTAETTAATAFFKTHPNPIDLEERGDTILFANRQVGLGFRKSANGFQFTRLHGIAEGHDFLSKGGVADIFQIVMTLDPKHVRKDERYQTRMGHYNILDEMAGESFLIGSHAGQSVSWRQDKTKSESMLCLEWKGIDVREDKGAMDVQVTIILREADPLSYWRISIKNRSERYGIERVRFPQVSFVPIGKAEDNVYLYPRGRGEVTENPFRQRNSEDFYPHTFNMQFQALYDKQSAKGLYLGTRDSAASFMCIENFHRPSEITWRPAHFPPNITFAMEDFTLPYDCVIGPFHGDWFDACQLYREWAIKQSWCRKGPLSSRKDVPTWYREAPLQLYTHLTDSVEGTHSLEDNMPIAAAHFHEFLKWTGMPLSANFYAWREYHPDLTSYNVPFNRYRMRDRGRWAGMPCENAHDGNYPRIPALPNFSSECKRLRDAGGMVSPYVALELFDQGPSENSPYAVEAKPHITRDLYGAIRTWGTETVWQPCSWTPWWRDRLKETCVLMLERENVGGFYLDVMQGCALPCYWTPHGHTAAGGTSMTLGMHQLSEYIYRAVKAKDAEAITSGENASENMIDVIDGVLQPTLTADTKAPLFAAVYQDYIRRHGLELSTGAKDADDFFIECASLFVEGSKIGMLRLRPRMGALSFQKPEHKEMLNFLDRLLGYYKQEVTRSFLVYGQLARPLKFIEPSPMPAVSHGSAGQFPSLMAGVFRTEHGELGVFLVNASTKELKFRADLDLSRYGLPVDAVVDVDAFASNGQSRSVVRKVKGAVPLEDVLSGRSAAMFRLKSSGN